MEAAKETKFGTTEDDAQTLNPCIALRKCATSHTHIPLDRSSQNFVCTSPMAVAWSLSGGVAILDVLPVLWMTSRLAIVGRMAMDGLSVVKYGTPSSVGRPGLITILYIPAGAE